MTLRLSQRRPSLVLTSVVIGVAVGVFPACERSRTETILDSPAQFKMAFASTHSDRVRRDLVLQAIDQGMIRVGMPLSELAELLGSPDLARPASSDEIQQSIVDLTDPPFAPNAAGQSPPQPQGWYLVLTHDGSHVQNYSLSNVHLK